MEQAVSVKKTKRKPKRLGSLAIILIEILVVLGIYFFGYIRSTTVFWPGTTINGVKVGGKTAKAAEKAINRTAVRLPSTSPANAAWSFERLYSEWRVIEEYIQKL